MVPPPPAGRLAPVSRLEVRAATSGAPVAVPVSVIGRLAAGWAIGAEEQAPATAPPVEEQASVIARPVAQAVGLEAAEANVSAVGICQAPAAPIAPHSGAVPEAPAEAAHGLAAAAAPPV